MREISDREMIHERLGDRFREALSDYDTEQRIRVLIDDFLGELQLRGRRVLEVGCGYGFFSQHLADLGAEVVACDISQSLVDATIERVGCAGHVADALCLTETFEVDSFDIVVSSECVEHTPDPGLAVSQMVAVCKPGGLISLSTPNVLWYPVVAMATWLRLRPFAGLENFSTFRSLRKHFESAGAEITQTKGLHLFPFQIPAHRLSKACDRRLQFLKFLMINLCVLARKADKPVP